MNQDNNQPLQLTQRHRNCLLHQCFFWIYHLIVLALAGAIISQIIIAYLIGQDVMKSSQLQHSLETVNLWNKGYIIDIKSVNTNNCPQGYTQLLSYTWPGTMEGCVCTDNSMNHTMEIILNGTCTSELIDLGCKTVAAMGQQTLQMWKGAKLICSKRAQSLNFYSSTDTVTAQGDTMKKCALNKTFQTNTLPNTSCPISQISNATLSASATNLLLDSINNQHLYYVSQSHYPIADFKITQYAFCEYLNDTNISPNKLGNYKLEISKYTPCTGLDTRYIEFDKMNQQEFYTNNTRVYDKLSQLPGYPRPSTNYLFKLGFIRYPEWSYVCRTSSLLNLNEATSHILYTKQKDMLYNLIAVSLPCLIIFALFFRLFFIIRHIVTIRQKMMYNAVFLKDQEIVQQLPNLNIIPNRKKQLIIFAIEQILRLIVLIIVIVTVLTMYDTSVWTKTMFRNSCSQDYINKIFRYYQTNTDKITQILIKICFIWGVMQVIDIVFLILRFCYMDLQGKQIKLQSQISMPSQSQEYEAIKAQSKQLQQINDKELKAAENSSQVILQKSKQIKIRDVDDIMGDQLYGASATKGNFYNQLQNSEYNLVTVKKKKKKPLKKNKKSLFKDEN